MRQMGQLLGIAIHERKYGSMLALSSARVTLEAGVAHDFRGTPGKRQVTVLALEDWQAACSEHGKDLPWMERRANLLVQGLALADTTAAIIKINSVQLRITRETDPCERMDQVSAGLCAALQSHWRGGVCCQVLVAGDITVGDTVELIHAE